MQGKEANRNHERETPLDRTLAAARVLARHQLPPLTKNTRSDFTRISTSLRFRHRGLSTIPLLTPVKLAHVRRTRMES